jgi:hypothetical protein
VQANRPSMFEFNCHTLYFYTLLKRLILSNVLFKVEMGHAELEHRNPHFATALVYS